METLQRDQITISGWNPRKTFDESELEELSKSIEQHGILEPLIVRPVGDHYELVAGERRFRASGLAGVVELPVVIKDLSDQEVHEIMLIENLQRSGLQPLEEAQSLEVLLQNSSQVDLAKKLGKSQPWVANRLRLLQAPEDLQQMLISREITQKHVIALLPYVGYKVMDDIINKLKEKTADDGCPSVSQLDDLCKSVIHYGSKHTAQVLGWCNDTDSYRSHFDLDECKACLNTVVEKRTIGNEDSVYCLDKKCYNQKIGAAKRKIDKEAKEALEKIKEMNKDFEEVECPSDWTTYEKFYSEEFDMTECHSCGHFKKEKDGDRYLCLDPTCFKKKKAAVAREKNNVEKELRQQVTHAINCWTDGLLGLNEIDTLFLVRTLVSICPQNTVKRACAPYGELESCWGDDLENFINDLSPEDYEPLLLRLAAFETMYRAYSYESLKSMIPEKMPFLQLYFENTEGESNAN